MITLSTAYLLAALIYLLSALALYEPRLFIPTSPTLQKLPFILVLGIVSYVITQDSFQFAAAIPRGLIVCLALTLGLLNLVMDPHIYLRGLACLYLLAAAPLLQATLFQSHIIMLSLSLYIGIVVATYLATSPARASLHLQTLRSSLTASRLTSGICLCIAVLLLSYSLFV